MTAWAAISEAEGLRARLRERLAVVRARLVEVESGLAVVGGGAEVLRLWCALRVEVMLPMAAEVGRLACVEGGAVVGSGAEVLVEVAGGRGVEALAWGVDRKRAAGGDYGD